MSSGLLDEIMNEPIVVNSTTLRMKTRDILEKARFERAHFIVQTHGRPMAAIIGVDEYRELLSLKSGKRARNALPEMSGQESR